MCKSIVVRVLAAMLLVLVAAFSASAQESGHGKRPWWLWSRLNFEERVQLASQRKLAKEANLIEREAVGGPVGGWASILIKNQSQTQTRDLWITIAPINQKGWYRQIWEKESLRAELAPGGEFAWQRGRYGRPYMVTVLELDAYGSRWETVYAQAHVPTRNTYGYTLTVPGRNETDWERDQRTLQQQLNLLLVHRAVRWDTDPELDAQIEALRDQISQSQKG